ncbi:class I SAM-dependent methyltransferase [Deinococcus roseus]|nr:class I SAM-dependent methyltransferase [Deinococcus roseus]
MTRLTLAQQSNFLPLTVWGYDLWRKRSLSLLTGEKFPLERELGQFLDWVKPVKGQHWLDVGTSTGNYARVLVHAGATVTALDLSAGFLQGLPRHPRLHPHQGNMEDGLFGSAAFHGVVVAGTLNETHSAERMLDQAVQALKADGLLYLMYLLPPRKSFGKLEQFIGLKAGVRFLQQMTTRKYLQTQSLTLINESQHGIVSFELYRKSAAPKENAVPQKSVVSQRAVGH